MYLKLADQFVKDGHFERALAQIARARTANPNNLYALAYEERVRALLVARRQGSADAPGADSALVTSIEQISTLAAVEAQRTLDSELRHAQELEAVHAEEEVRRRLEQERQAALAAKMRVLLQRIIDYQARNDFRRALDEVARAYVLDPGNEEVRLLEAQLLQEQQEAEHRAEVDRVARVREEEVARDRIIRAEQVRQESEREELRRNADAARRAAQQAKIREYLDRAREHLASGSLDETLTELAFVVVMEPLNEEVVHLERTVREAIDRRQREQLELSRRREQEHTKRLEALRVTLQKHIREAEELAAGNEFSEALRVITRACLLDPLNREVQACEERIIQAQEAALRRADEERRAAEEALRRKREEDLQRMGAAERERLERIAREEEETRRRGDQEQIRTYLRKAGEFLAEGRLDNALGELALAFIIDPFDTEIRSLEQEILRAREESRAAETPAPAGPARTAAPIPPMPHEAARERLWRALELLDQHLYDDALQEIERGLREDPDSEDLRTLKNRIATERLHAPEAGGAPAFDTTHRAAPAAGSAQGGDGMQVHGDAQWEDVDVRGDGRERAFAPDVPEDAPLEGRREDAVRIRLRGAEELARGGRFSEALDEIARAYAADPLDPEIRKTEILIRQAEARSAPSRNAEDRRP